MVLLFNNYSSYDHCSSGLVLFRSRLIFISKRSGLVLSKTEIWKITASSLSIDLHKQLLRKEIKKRNEKLDVITRCYYKMITISESDQTTPLSHSTVPSFVALCVNGKAFFLLRVHQHKKI